MSRIYLSPPDVGSVERELLLDAFDSNWIAPLGPHVDAFEGEMAQRAGVEHGAALSSGTAALHLALDLVGVRPGDEVLVPTFTFVATANAVRYLGAVPVFVDSDCANWCLDAELVASQLRERVRNGSRPGALVAVDLYGNLPDYDTLTATCAELEIPLIEDAAEALGSTYCERPAGSFGTCAAFSFNGNKIITTSGGGMLVSHSAELVGRARYLASQARQPVVHYEHAELGYNYRLSNLLAALGRGQLRGLDQRIASRKAIFERYRDAFAPVPGIDMMPSVKNVSPNYWLTCVTIDPQEFGADREQVRLALEDLDIESRPTWKPLHLQPLYKDCEMIRGSVSEAVFGKGLCLPTGSQLSVLEQERIIETILRIGGDGR
jgi:dTDP-4-amino-4,6-dideoxygalactose transaminase